MQIIEQAPYLARNTQPSVHGTRSVNTEQIPKTTIANYTWQTTTKAVKEEITLIHITGFWIREPGGFTDLYIGNIMPDEQFVI